MCLGFPFPSLPASLSPLFLLSVSPLHARRSVRHSVCVCVLFLPLLRVLFLACSIRRGTRREKEGREERIHFYASVGSGMDHLIHPICIPLMLPGVRGMSSNNPAACAQSRTYGTAYPCPLDDDDDRLDGTVGFLQRRPSFHGKLPLLRDSGT